MSERLIQKLDRLGAEAGIKQMTPEIYNFAMLVRADVVAQWPERPWVDLTDEEIGELIIGTLSADTNPAQTRPRDIKFARSVLATFKEKNNGTTP